MKKVFSKIEKEAIEVIKSLRRSRKLKIACPNCGTRIPTFKAEMFTENTLTEKAKEFEEVMKDSISDLKEEILSFKKRKLDGLAKTTYSTNAGKLLEKFAPILRGFNYKAVECRPLFEPIDYVNFNGLSRANIESIHFVDVKSGQARLNNVQKAVRDAISVGKVSFHLIGKEK